MKLSLAVGLMMGAASVAVADFPRVLLSPGKEERMAR